MEPTVLENFIQNENVELLPDGIRVIVNPAWIVAGEDRLSYTTMIRLVEYCREHHWKTDVLSSEKDKNVDSITKKIEATFEKPINVGEQINISYKINRLGNSSYTLKFEISDAIRIDTRFATVFLICVFYDSIRQEKINIPQTVRENLRRDMK